MRTILDEMREAKFNHIVRQTLQQRRENISRDVSARTLRLMESIVIADIEYDIANGIDYECEAEGGAA